MTDTNDRLSEIRGRVEAATAGPWGLDARPSLSGMVYCDDVFGTRVADCNGRLTAVRLDVQENAAFIAHAREDVPWLLAEVERLQAEIKRRDLWAADHA